MIRRDNLVDAAEIAAPKILEVLATIVLLFGLAVGPGFLADQGIDPFDALVRSVGFGLLVFVDQRVHAIDSRGITSGPLNLRRGALSNMDNLSKLDNTKID
jgi:hypothetical protein